ncbi:retrovirus-related Pol polyprotein from transposon 412 [Trichonephila clavipes]|uniref:Retrovirus-related Pol polyprotein from transposon 412 n=1 Tax=Trichonephila clavipes TaxID=2585209 RepID=A0A8X6W6D1_TRICX|nr:retrovirus-related Pol polyprotein from transposon 412 [Trichonephila clavipes]
MLFGRDLRLPADILFSRPLDAPLAPEEYIEKLQARMDEIHHLDRERIGMASEKMKTRYDTRVTGHDFHEGDKVWLWNPKRCKGLSPKLQTNWEGPYTVLKRLNDVVARIQRSPHSKNRSDSLRTWRNLGGRAKLATLAIIFGDQVGDFGDHFGVIGDHVGVFGTLWNLLESSGSLH